MKKTSALITGMALCAIPFCQAQDAAEHKPLTFLLTGASFAVPENGWFEIGCDDMGANAINKAVSGEAIYHTARRMDAGTFYDAAQLDTIDVFVIGHVHNQNVANEQWLKESWEDYTSIASTTDYSVAYDYVIKRYIADCKALKDNPESKYYGTADGKPVKIMFCTHWHDSRTTYNPAIRKLAQKWGLPLRKFDDNLGFSRLDVAAGEDQPSRAYAHDTETINGVKYGWHPLRGDNSFIQRRMAQIFVEEAASYLGLSVPFDYTLSPCSPLVMKGETARMLVNFRGGHYPFEVKDWASDGIKACPYFLEVSNVQADTEFSVPGIIDAKGSEAASGASKASVLLADMAVPSSYDSFVHQAEQSKGHADAQTLDLKNGDGWSRRIYLTFPLDGIPDDAERIGIRLYYESVVPGKLNNENRPLNGIEELRLEGNTSTYTANLTWDNHHSHKFEYVGSTPLSQDMLNSYVGWDVTDFVKSKAAEGAKQVSFRVSTPYKWRALSRFTASESTSAPEHAPMMLIAEKRGGTSSVGSLDASASLRADGTTLYNPCGTKVVLYNALGAVAMVSSASEIDLSLLVPGVYVAASGAETLKILVRGR